GLRQEWILGVGGVRVLHVLGYDPAAWHANEGHAAFMLVERVRELVTRGTSFAEAVRRVRATSVFTTHTPVPAGHDTFSLEQVEQCIGPVWQEMGVSREAFFRLGHHPVADHDRFHMPVAAIRLSARVSAVSRRHGEESRRIWAPLWPDREVARAPIGHVTNGVHVATWMANRILTLFDSHFGPDWLARVDDPAFWDEVLELDGIALWAVHKALKSHLVRSIRATSPANRSSSGCTPTRGKPGSRAGSPSSRTTTCISPTAWCRAWTSGSTCRGHRSRHAARVA